VDRSTRRGREALLAGADCGLGGRVHPEIACWAKVKTPAEGAALATKKLRR